MWKWEMLERKKKDPNIIGFNQQPPELQSMSHLNYMQNSKSIGVFYKNSFVFY